MHADVCGANNPGVCDGMDPYNGELLREYLLNVNFTGEYRKCDSGSVLN